jgi:hypothetical protein
MGLTGVLNLPERASRSEAGKPIVFEGLLQLRRST